jgi:two-component system nitrogen regulation response regulator NtrX
VPRRHGAAHVKSCRFKHSATNRPLDALAAEGRFRQDLFYRLAVVPIRVPALRERRDDIGDLARHFLVEFCRRNNMREKTVADDAMSALERYDWPGNVRELRNVVERMAILTPGPILDVESLPAEIRTPALSTSRLHDVRDAAERDRIRETLEQTDWNVSRAARLLGIERTHLHKRMRALGLDRTR